MHIWTRISVAGGIAVVLLGCASTPTASSPSPVLESVDAKAPESPASAASEEVFTRLQERLTELGYEGIGFEHEDEAVLNLLLLVFQSAEAAGRKISAVYTGAALDYDAAHESLTLGGTQDLQEILKFIQAKVPKN